MKAVDVKRWRSCGLVAMGSLNAVVGIGVVCMCVTLMSSQRMEGLFLHRDVQMLSGESYWRESEKMEAVKWKMEICVFSST
jgi:hypothetical protein